MKEANFMVAISFDKIGSGEHKDFQKFLSESLRNGTLESIKAFDSNTDLQCAQDLVDKEFFMY